MRTLITLLAFIQLGCLESGGGSSSELSPEFFTPEPQYVSKNFRIEIMKTTNNSPGSSVGTVQELYRLDNELLTHIGDVETSFNNNMGSVYTIQQDAVGLRVIFSGMDVEEYMYDVYIDNVFEARVYITDQPGEYLIELGDF